MLPRKLPLIDGCYPDFVSNFSLLFAIRELRIYELISDVFKQILQESKPSQEITAI